MILKPSSKGHVLHVDAPAGHDQMRSDLCKLQDLVCQSERQHSISCFNLICRFCFVQFSGFSFCCRGMVFVCFAVLKYFTVLHTARCPGENQLRDKLWALYQRAVDFATKEGTEAGARAHIREIIRRRGVEPLTDDEEQNEKDEKDEDQEKGKTAAREKDD